MPSGILLLWFKFNSNISLCILDATHLAKDCKYIDHLFKRPDGSFTIIPLQTKELIKNETIKNRRDNTKIPYFGK